MCMYIDVSFVNLLLNLARLGCEYVYGNTFKKYVATYVMRKRSGGKKREKLGTCIMFSPYSKDYIVFYEV